jgi:hypothetical protein
MGRVASAGDNTATESFNSLPQNNALDTAPLRERGAEARDRDLDRNGPITVRVGNEPLGVMTPVEFKALDLAMKPSKSKESNLYLHQPQAPHIPGSEIGSASFVAVRRYRRIEAGRKTIRESAVFTSAAIPMASIPWRFIKTRITTIMTALPARFRRAIHQTRFSNQAKVL